MQYINNKMHILTDSTEIYFTLCKLVSIIVYKLYSYIKYHKVKCSLYEEEIGSYLAHMHLYINKY